MKRAGELIERFAARRPLAVRLAEAVSLAVLADPRLLRKARLDLVPEADPGIEADLWMSPLVQTRSPDGLVFAAEVGEALRTRLAADSARLEEAWRITKKMHRHLTPALRLEEEIAFLSLTSESDPRAAARIEELLRSALAAVVMGEMRGLAHWAARALPKLPSRVRVSQAARLLEAGAHLRLGGDTRPLRNSREILDFPWMAPADLPRVPVGLRLFPDAIELDARSDPPGPHLLLPQTDPLLVELSWQDPASGQREARQVTFRKGEKHKIETPVHDLRLRTVLGEVYDLRAAGTAPRGVQDWIIDFSEELARHRPFFGRTEERLRIGRVLRKDVSESRNAGRLILVTGETGAGKTALLAQFVVGPETPHHFFRRGRDLEDVGRAERSLIGQIVRRFPELSPMASHLGLQGILESLSDRGLVSPQTGPLVLVLDGIDEASSADGASEGLLGLLAKGRIPDGVVILASAAPDHQLDLPQLVDIAPLTKAEPGLREYWSHYLGEDDEVLTQLSAGNFGVAEILRFWMQETPGTRFLRRDPGALDAIWQSLERQVGEHARDSVLGPLAAAFEPLPVSLYSGPVPTDSFPWVGKLLRVHETAGEPLYELREEVLRGFVASRLDLTDYHARLGAAAEAAIFNESSTEQARRYGLRHTAEHWIAAGNLESARRLLLRADYLIVRCRDSGVAAARRDLRRWLDTPTVVAPVAEESAGDRSYVFVSYSKEDLVDARALVRRLREQELQVWIDESPGVRSWREEFESILARSSAFLALVGPYGIGEWQSSQINAALAIQARSPQYRIIPLLLPGAKPPEGPLRNYQAVPFVESVEESGPLASLVAAIKVDPDFNEQNRARVAAVLEALVQEEPLLARDPAALPSVLYNSLRIAGWEPDEIVHTLALPPGELHLRLRAAPEELTRTGPIRHRGSITGCAFVGLDGSALFTWSTDHSLRVWDATDGSLRSIFSAHTSEITACVLLDGGRSVSASRAGGLRVWNTQTLLLVPAMFGHEGEILGVLALDGHRGVSWSTDRTIRVWDLTEGREVMVLRGHEGAVTACALTPDRRHLVSGSEDTTVRIWDLASGRLLRTERGHTGPVTCVAAPDGHFVYSGSLDRTLRAWSMEGDEEPQVLEGHTMGILGCAVSPDDLTLATWSYDRTVRLWLRGGNKARWELEGSIDHPQVLPLATLTGHEGAVLSCAFFSEGDRLVSCSADRTVRIWDVETHEEVAVLQGHEAAVRSVAISSRQTSFWQAPHPSTDLIASASDDRTIRVWNAQDPGEVTILDGDNATLLCLPFQDRRRVVTFSRLGDLHIHHVDNPVPDWIGSPSMTVGGGILTPDERRLILWSQGLVEGKVRFTAWDLAERKEVADFYAHDAPILACAVTPDGTTLLTASLDGTVRNFSLVNWMEMPAIEEASPVSSLAAVAFPSGRLALRGLWDGTVVFWIVDRSVRESRFTGHTDRVLACAITPDGLRAVSASADQTLRLWDLQTGGTLAVLTGHTAEVTGCAFTRDGRRIVSRSKDGRLGLWDGEAGQLIAFTQGHTNWVTAFAVDEEFVYSASEDQTVRAWDLATGEPRGVVYGVSPFRSLAAVQGGVYAGDEAGNLWPLERAVAPTPGEAA